MPRLLPSLSILAALFLAQRLASALMFTVNTTIGPQEAAFDGQDIVISACTLTIDGAHSFKSLLLTNNAVLRHSPALTGQADRRVDLTVAGNLSVLAGSSIDVNALGFGAASGPGAGISQSTPPWYAGGGGGAYGGDGGRGRLSSGLYLGGRGYGNPITPAQHGSGGGGFSSYVAPSGGGIIQLAVGGVCRVDGTIMANGGSSAPNAACGGGAGGSILITASNFVGNGVITAYGGTGAAFGNYIGGGGGGGRIAISYLTSAFAGTVVARGGNSTIAGEGGGAGSIYLKPIPASLGSLLLDNTGLIAALVAPSHLSTPAPVNVTLGKWAFAYPAGPLAVGSLMVRSNGGLKCATVLQNYSNLIITATGDVTIEQGAQVSADSAGFYAGEGPGAGGWALSSGGGGGHGGAGGGWQAQTRGLTNDSPNAPVLPGSGGGGQPSGGAGGGAIRITTPGMLRVDGRLSANGSPASSSGYGSGAGGSIYLIVGALAGSGPISANGGTNSQNAGGGGGGRIAIYRTNSTHVGSVTALAGPGTYPGSAGTVLQTAPVVISGVVTEVGGQPLPGVTISATGLASTTSDLAGRYALSLPLQWSGVVTIGKAGWLFTPSNRTYNAVSLNQQDQDFSAHPVPAPELQVTVVQAGLQLRWAALSGVQYLLQSSTNLLVWTGHPPAYAGTDGFMQLLVPATNAGSQFFRLEAGN